MTSSQVVKMSVNDNSIIVIILLLVILLKTLLSCQIVQLSTSGLLIIEKTANETTPNQVRSNQMVGFGVGSKIRACGENPLKPSRGPTNQTHI